MFRPKTLWTFSSTLNCEENKLQFVNLKICKMAESRKGPLRDNFLFSECIMGGT